MTCVFSVVSVSKADVRIPYRRERLVVDSDEQMTRSSWRCFLSVALAADTARPAATGMAVAIRAMRLDTQ